MNFLNYEELDDTTLNQYDFTEKEIYTVYDILTHISDYNLRNRYRSAVADILKRLLRSTYCSI